MLTKIMDTTHVRVSKRTLAILKAASRRYDRTVRELIDCIVDAVFVSNGECRSYLIASPMRTARTGRRSYLRRRATKCTRTF